MDKYHIMFSDAVIHQSQMFLRALLWGCLFVAGYDCIRIFRRIFWHKIVLMAIEDICFCIAGAVVLYTWLFKYDDGAVRSYTLLGVSTGAAGYYFLISRWFVPMISHMLQRVFEKIMKFLSSVLKKLRKTGTIVKTDVQRKKHEKEIKHDNKEK